MAVEIPLAGSTYEFAPVSNQLSINVEPIAMEAIGQTRFRLVQTPGQDAFASVSGAARGGVMMGGVAYVVHGQSLYSVSSVGTATSLGTVVGSGLVSMANNGRYVVVVNGQEGYYYDTNTSTFAQITDPDFRPADTVEYLDGYFVSKETGSSNVFISSANNPTAYNAAEVQSKGGDPDSLVTIRSIQGDLLLLGETHSYFWRNTGNVDFPFENIEGAEMERGCIAKRSVAGIDNSVIFLGDDRIVYWVDGYVPTRVSNHAFEEYLSTLSLSDCQGAYGFAYTQQGRYYYCLTVGGQTWCYNRTESLVVGQALWHQRSSGGAAWSPVYHLEAYGKHLVGVSGGVRVLNPRTRTEAGATIYRTRRLAPLWMEDEFYPLGKLKLLMKVGTGTLTDPPEIHLRTSKDGFTWNDYKTRTTGKLGEYMTQVIWRRLGQAKNRVIEFTWSADADIELYGLYGEG